MGGAIYAGQGNLKLYNTSLVGNLATTAGSGLYLEQKMQGSATAHNTIVANNPTTQQSNVANNPHTSLSGVVNNPHTSLSGVVNNPHTSLSGVVNNPHTSLSGVANCQFDGFSDLSDSVANLADDNSCGAGFAVKTAQELALGALGDWGGATQTIPLLPGSAAIDAGTDVTCPATDQRGITRPQGTHCDVGAFESRGFNVTLLSGNNQSTLINLPFRQKLGIRVSSPFDEPVNGGWITFRAPGQDQASTTFGPATIETIKNGRISFQVWANDKPGSYAVSTDASGALNRVTFHLTNRRYTGSRPVLVAPQNGTTVHTRAVTLKWLPAAIRGVPAVPHRVMVRDLTTGKIVVNVTVTDAASYITAPLVPGHTYAWQVVACVGSDCRRSQTWRFTVAEDAR
jgi:hypothetical protein